MNKNSKGITLIALIITIIILLILAGITINFVIGGNNLFVKAGLAKEEYKIQEIKERIEVNILEYEANLREKTLYSFLTKVEKLESISPDNEVDGPPYILIVEGYRFEVKYISSDNRSLEVVYLGKDTGIVPEIKKYEIQLEQSKESANLELSALTKDSQGLSKILLMRNDVLVQEKQINGNSIEEIINVRTNGRYRIRVVAKNGKFVDTDEKEITQIVNHDVTGTIVAGTEVDNKVKLQVNGTSSKTTISKIEVYIGNNKIGEQSYAQDKSQEYYEIEQDTSSFAFYEEQKAYAIIEDTQGSRGISNEIDIGNRSKIRTEKDFNNFAKVVNDGNSLQGKIITQENDITLVNNHTAIGTNNNPFKGTFDGNQHLINNIKIDVTQSEIGLFGKLESGTIQNVTIQSGNIKGTYNVGAICGVNYSGKVINCKNLGAMVTSTGYTEHSYVWTTGQATETVKCSNVGGIIGYNYNGNVTSCTNKGQVKGSYTAIGGIIGSDEGSVERKISSCSNTANISNTFAEGNAGYGQAGIIGISYNLATIQDCKNEGTLTSNGMNCAGVVGGLINGKVNNCSNIGSITGIAGVGGICGEIVKRSDSEQSYIQNCTNTGSISTTGLMKDLLYDYWDGQTNSYRTSAVGGICGLNAGGKIESCKNSGKIVAADIAGGESDLGGIVGVSRNGSKILRCSNLVSLGSLSNTKVGGIAGMTLGNTLIEECYNIGQITGNTWVGGIAGYSVYTQVKNCYNTANITGKGEYVGGILGAMITYQRSIGYNYLYNCYNIGKISGTQKVDGFVGKAFYTTWDHLYTIDNLGNPAGGEENNVSGTYQEFPNTEAGKTSMLTALLNGNGASKWSRNMLNNAYPYLLNNVP